MPPFIAQVATPCLCNNPIMYGDVGRGKAAAPCGFDLATVERTAASEKALQAQRQLDELLAAPQDDAATVDWFAELRSICAVMLYCAEVEDFQDTHHGAADFASNVGHRLDTRMERLTHPEGKKADRDRVFLKVPTQPALMALLLTNALPIVREPAPAALAERLRPLVDRAKEVNKNHTTLVQHFRFSQRLDVAWRRASPRRFSYQTKGNAFSMVSQYRVEEVPQMIPLTVYRQRFYRFFPTLTSELARQFVALAAAKALGLTWIEAARQLDLPDIAAKQANHGVVLLTKAGLALEFNDELRSWGREYAALAERPDYRLLRQVLKDLKLFAPNDWQEMCAQANISEGLGDARNRYCAAWIWGEVTQGRWVNSPAFGGETTANQRQVFKTLMNTIEPRIGPVLRKDAAQRFAAHVHIT